MAEDSHHHHAIERHVPENYCLSEPPKCRQKSQRRTVPLEHRIERNRQNGIARTTDQIDCQADTEQALGTQDVLSDLRRIPMHQYSGANIKLRERRERTQEQVHESCNYCRISLLMS